MQVHERPDGTLVLTYDSVRLSLFFAALGVLVLALLGHEYLVGARAADRLVGGAVGAGTCVIMAVVVMERLRVTVNATTRTLEWSRQWGFQTKAGTLPFDDIDAVLAERALADEGLPSRRLVLRAKDGRSIPLMVAYRTDRGDIMLRTAERIGALLGKGGGTTASVEALAAAGRLIDAIALLREKEGLSLTEAKRRADALRSRTPR